MSQSTALPMNLRNLDNELELTPPGEAKGELGRPMNLEVHQEELYVPEYFNGRIQVFDLGDNLLCLLALQADGPSEFNAPDRTVFVADFLNNRIQKWRPRR